VRVNGELLSQINSRLMRADERLNEGRIAVTSLATQLRGVEQAAVHGSYESTSQRGALAGK
jgi:hypothetical protein